MIVLTCCGLLIVLPVVYLLIRLRWYQQEEGWRAASLDVACFDAADQVARSRGFYIKPDGRNLQKIT